jgi:hypothetical protein
MCTFFRVLDKGLFVCIIQKESTWKGENRMMIRVIYKDQTAGVIESHLLDTLIRKGRIVAYHSVDRWVPVEPKMVRPVAGVNGVQPYRDELLKYNSH